MKRPVDISETARFLEALVGRPNPAVTFQTFDDSKAKRTDLARISHGTLPECAQELIALNECGAGVFVTVNETDLKGRKIENVVAVRALFVDADGPIEKPWALEPDIIVESGRGMHAYWTVTETPLEAFTPAQKRLATFYGTDPMVSDLPRVMRLPGFFHLKGEPKYVSLVRAKLGDAVHDHTAVLALHPVTDPEPAPAPPPLAPAPAPPALSHLVYRASRYLARIDGAVSGQAGHQTTWDAAIALVRGFSLPTDVALDLLLNEYNPRCSPPWSEKELRHKVDSAAGQSQLPDGYLIGEPDPPSRVSLGGRVLSGGAAAALAPAPAPGPDTEAVVLQALADGRAVEELVPLLADVRNEITRDQLVKRVAHERHVVRSAILHEVKRVRAARRKLKVVAAPPPGGDGPAAATQPDILLEAGQLHVTVGKAEEALLASEGVPVFQRGNVLVRVIRTESLTVWRRRRKDPAVAEGDAPLFQRPSGALVIHPVETAYLIDRFTAAANWKKWDARVMDWRPADCPPKVAEVYLARAGDWKVRPLIGIIEAPTLRPDGSILEEPGYDETTGLLYDQGDTDFPAVPPSPSQEDARGALQLLLALLKDFPFVAAADRSAALSALLTGLVRKSIKTAPLHAFRAPKMRSGKTLLADLVSLLATGRTAAVLSQNYEKPDEEKKRLLAVLLAGDPVICYDNIDKPFGGAALCQALTQETISDRILGVSQMATAPTAATFLATGNNLIFEADITSRVVPCDLDPEVERPEEREFDVNLYEEVPRRRGELVVAALTVLRAYHVAGRPSAGIPRWGGFEEWSDWVRSALVWLGQADCAEGRSRVEELDPERRQLRSILAAWAEAFRDRTLTLGEAIKEANLPLNETLKDVFLDIAGTRGEVNPHRLAGFIRHHERRIEGGLRFVRCGISHSVTIWGVIKTGERGERGERGVFSSPTRERTSALETNMLFPPKAETTPPNPPNPPASVSTSFTCPDCGSQAFRLSKSGKPICTTCWGPS